MMNLALRGILLGLLCYWCVSCPVGKICDGKEHNEEVGDRRLVILEDGGNSSHHDNQTLPKTPKPGPVHVTDKPVTTTASDASPSIPTSLAVLAASLFLSVIWFA